MNFMNLKVAKKETRKTSLILWAASLALLMQQSLHAAESSDEGEAPGAPAWKYADISVSEDEVLSMSEGTIDNFLSTGEITDESYLDVFTALQHVGGDTIQTVEQREATMQEAQNLLTLVATPDELGTNNLALEVVKQQALYTAQNEIERRVTLFKRVANNAEKLLRNKDRVERRKEQELRKALAASQAQTVENKEENS